jgi:hypothetical protein
MSADGEDDPFENDSVSDVEYPRPRRLLLLLPRLTCLAWAGGILACSLQNLAVFTRSAPLTNKSLTGM